jgi:hypothetical protein
MVRAELRPFERNPNQVVLVVHDEEGAHEMCLLDVNQSQGWPAFVPWIREKTGDEGLTPNRLWGLLEQEDVDSAMKVLTGARQAIAIRADSHEQRRFLWGKFKMWRPLMQGLSSYLQGSEFRGVGLLPTAEQFVQRVMQEGETNLEALKHFLVLGNAFNIAACDWYLSSGEAVSINSLDPWNREWRAPFRVGTLALMGGKIPPLIPWGDFAETIETREPSDRRAWSSSRLIELLWRFGMHFRLATPELMFGGLACVISQDRWGRAPSRDDFPRDVETLADLSDEDRALSYAGQDVAACVENLHCEVLDASRYSGCGRYSTFAVQPTAEMVDMQPGVNAVCQVGLTRGIAVVLGAQTDTVLVIHDGTEEPVRVGLSAVLTRGINVLRVIDPHSRDIPTRLTVRPESMRGVLTFFVGPQHVANLRVERSPIRVVRDFRRIYEVQGEVQFKWEGDGVRLWTLRGDLARHARIKSGSMPPLKNSTWVEVNWFAGETQLHFM